MTRTSLRLCAAAFSLAVVALPGAAFAGTLDHSDPARDVQKLTTTGSGTTITDAPSQKSADIVHLNVSYTASRLKETVRLRGLATTWSYSSRIKTSTTHFDLGVTHQSGTTEVALTDAGSALVTCDGLTRTVDRTRHTVSVKIPTGCLDSPPAVKVGAGMVVIPKTGGVFYADDALRRGSVRTSLTLSDRITQG